VVIQGDARLVAERLGGDAGEVGECLRDRVTRRPVVAAVGDPDAAGERGIVDSACRDAAYVPLSTDE
jgi:hypothetical protein